MTSFNPQFGDRSPNTQYILDAYESATDKYKALAAVLRALVNLGDSMYDAEADHELVGVVRDSLSLAIANELDTL